MVQSPSWEANWFAASQEIPRILCNPKVHYRTHKRPLPVPTLGQPNPVHIPTSHLLEIYPNIIHTPTPRSPQWSLSLQLQLINIIIIIIIIIIISFMQGIYTYIPETNYVPREYSVAAILLLLFMVLISLVPVLNLLYFYISTFRSMCAVPNMAVFCSSLTSWFPGMLLTYFLNVFEIVPVAPIITGITFIFTFHKRSISIVLLLLLLCLRWFQA